MPAIAPAAPAHGPVPKALSTARPEARGTSSAKAVIPANLVTWNRAGDSFKVAYLIDSVSRAGGV